MENLPYALVTAACLGVVLWAEVAGRPAYNAVFKPLASLAFVLCGLLLAPRGPLYVPLVTALLLSWVGDVLLIPKGRRRIFIAGIAAFLAAHVAYGWLFLRLGVDSVTAAIAAAVGLVVAMGVLRWLGPRVHGPMRAAVVAYVVVISAMVALAVGATGAGTGALPTVAATSFWLSDLAVARHRFVRAEAVNRLVGLPLYYAAQYLFIALVR